MAELLHDAVDGHGAQLSIRGPLHHREAYARIRVPRHVSVLTAGETRCLGHTVENRADFLHLHRLPGRPHPYARKQIWATQILDAECDAFPVREGRQHLAEPRPEW